MYEDVKAFLKQSNFNGSVLVAKDNKIILNEGYGYANFEHSVLNDSHTVFRIASITKQFTATAILKLYEEGLLKLDDLLSQYIPDFAGANKITIHHLLSNSSGIPNFSLDMDFYFIINSESVLLSLLDCIKNRPLMFEPGTQFYYSITGFLVLQYIIEMVSGMDYETYLKLNFFDRLKLSNTGFEYPNKVIKRKAEGYRYNDDIIEKSDYIDMRIAGGGGALYSTTKELYTWTNALLNYDILSKETMDMMLSPQIAADEVNSYGYGMIIAKGDMQGKERVKYYHPGGGNGVRAFDSIYPKEKLQIIIISNVEDKNTFEKIRTKLDETFLKQAL